MKIIMAGKGDRYRAVNIKKFCRNFENINWDLITNEEKNNEKNITKMKGKYNVDS